MTMLDQETLLELQRLRYEIAVLAHAAHANGVLQAPRPKYSRRLASVNTYARVRVISVNAEYGLGLALRYDDSVQMVVRIPKDFIYGLDIDTIYYVLPDAIKYPENSKRENAEITRTLLDKASISMEREHAARTANQWAAYDLALRPHVRAYEDANAASANAAIMDAREQNSRLQEAEDAA